MQDATIIPLALILGRWHEFYSLLGTASATMIGLLFVAASVGTGVFSAGRRAPMRVFLSASVVHFSSVLAVSLIIIAPLQSRGVLAGLVAMCGAVGLAYSCLAWRDTVRDELNAAIDLEDRVWYILLPVGVYLLEIAVGISIAWHTRDGCVGLAVVTGMLLLIGIHNAWDITVWMITRRRE